METGNALKAAQVAVPVDHSLDGQSQTTYIISVLTVACVLSTAAVLARMYTRLFVLRTFGWDDFVMAVAQVFTLMSATAIFLETAYGLGRHTWLITTNYVPYMKSFFVSIIFYNVGICIVKISILLQYKRIFQIPILQKLTIGGLVFEGAWALTLSVLLPLVCTPVSAFWDVLSQGRCLNQLAIWYAMATLNLITDFVIFSMPIPVIKSLQLPKKQKYMLMGVFCLGFCTCIISVYRITTLKAAADSEDPAWENTDAAVWSLLELAIGVLAACLPTLKPLFAMAMPRLFKSTLTNRANQYRLDYERSCHGPKSTRPRLPSQYVAGGVMYLKEIDDDMDALSPSRRSGSAAERADIETQMPRYNVRVTGGHENSQEGRVVILGGIQTTTVITQRVDSL